MDVIYEKKTTTYPSYSPASDTNLLDCSCDGVVALALGSSVYLWNSETRCVVGHLDQATPSGQPSSDCLTRSITCLCWSGDGRILCIGTRRREIQVYAQMWRWEETAGQTVCVTNLYIQFNNHNMQLPWLCLWLCSCGMLNTRRQSGLCRHTCLWSELFPGNKTYWAGRTGTVCESHDKPSIFTTVLTKPQRKLLLKKVHINLT